MKYFAIACALTVSPGCDAMLSRPAPSEAEYRQQYLYMLSDGQIQDLRFTYYGAIGGESSLARFKTDEAGVEAIRTAATEEHLYKPGDLADRRVFWHRIEAYAGHQEVPAWFDFPRDKTLPVYVRPEDSSNSGPGFSYEWYVDEETSTVYFVMVRG